MSETNPQTGTTTDADAAAPAVPEEEKEEEEEEEDLEKLQKEIERMEAEAARITKEADEIDKKGATAGGDTSAGKQSAGEGGTSDGHSIYVGQVDYNTTPEELLAHFEACGTVERVTIVCDKYTGTPKGFAYLEFQTESSVANAIKLDGSEFKGRNLKVTPKRVNVAGYNRQQGSYEQGGGRGGRGGFRGGRGGRGGGRGRGRSYRGGYRGRGRGRGGYHPYY